MTIQQERDFLLRSLDDLETERAAGNIDDATYGRLRSDYTARAAAAVRALRDGIDSRPTSPPVSTRRRVLTIAAVVAFATAAGVALAYSVGGRAGGGGNAGRVTLSQREATFRAAVDKHPDNVDAQLALARFFLGERKFPDALRHYDAAARLGPTLPEPKAYGGWILYLSSLQVDPGQRPRLIDDAQARIEAAIRANDAYSDAHFFRGLLLYRGRNDASAAIPELQRYLTLAPDAPQADAVRQLLADAVNATGSTSSTVHP